MTDSYCKISNQVGSQQTVVPIRDSIWIDTELEIIDHQVYLGGRRLTESNSKKRLARRLNSDRLLFLSDEKRGPGFYTLRTIALP